jgi:hypothetical protein
MPARPPALSTVRMATTSAGPGLAIAASRVMLKAMTCSGCM